MIEARRSIFSRLVAGAIVLSLVLLAGLWWLTHQTVSTTLQEAARAVLGPGGVGLRSGRHDGTLPPANGAVAVGPVPFDD